MKGQWIGETKEIDAKVVLNIDDRGMYYSGVVYVLPVDIKSTPAMAVFFKTINKDRNFNFKAEVVPINPETGFQSKWKEIEHFYPAINFPKEVDVEGRFEFENEDLFLNAKTTLGTEVSARIKRKASSEDSEIKSEVWTWEKYKKDVSEFLGKGYLFRGQRKNWKLRTAFHREGRYDIDRFLKEDRLKLYYNLTARLSHVFNLDNPFENGALLNLAQHHGYPTPLLDWTSSPYIAAFFAFRRITKKTQDDYPYVRIFIFNWNKWNKDWNQVADINSPYLHFSVMEFLAIENERLIPQQAVATATNIDDIETYIQDKESAENKYLTAIEIPVTEKNNVMKELAFMGITAGSMFPGLDGACEELKEKFFEE